MWNTEQQTFLDDLYKQHKANNERQRRAVLAFLLNIQPVEADRQPMEELERQILQKNNLL